jgi:hypothetical protein
MATGHGALALEIAHHQCHCVLGRYRTIHLWTGSGITQDKEFLMEDLDYAWRSVSAIFLRKLSGRMSVHTSLM